MKIQNHSLPRQRLEDLRQKLKRSIIHFFVHSRKASLAIMGIVLVVSAVFCFTINRYPKPKSMFALPALGSGFPEVPSTPSAALIEILSLQGELRTFLDEKIPSKNDSIRMEQIIIRIQALNKSLKNHEKH